MSGRSRVWQSNLARSAAVGLLFLGLLGGAGCTSAGADEIVLKIAEHQDPQAGWPESAIDVGPRFQSFFVDGRMDAARVDHAFAAVRDQLRGLRMVIVPSYLVDLLRPGIRLGIIDYFSGHSRWLESLGVETLLAPVNTQATVATNAGDLAALLTSSDKPVCILSHSKGGLDTLAALSILSPDDLARVRCWISFQAPFAGSPLADLAAQAWLFRPVANLALSLLGGSPRSLEDLTTTVRRRELTAAEPAIRRVVSTVPTLAVATVLGESADLWPHSLFALTRPLVADEGVVSDGIVPTSSAILPHARYVVIEGLDHGDPVDLACAPGTPGACDVLLLKALLAITLGAE